MRKFVLFLILLFAIFLNVGCNKDSYNENTATQIPSSDVMATEDVLPTPTAVAVETDNILPTSTADVKVTENVFVTESPKPTPTQIATPSPTNVATPTDFKESVVTPTASPKPHEHIYTKKITKPTCEKKGFTNYICSGCGDKYVSDYVSAVGHKYASDVIKANCTEGGFTHYTCLNCGESHNDKYTKALGHNWGEWVVVKEATMYEEGTKNQSCKRCNKVRSEAIQKLPMIDLELQNEVLRLVNIERKKAGLSTLSYYYAGQAAADIRALEIEENFSHTRPNGSEWASVLPENDINYCAAGENIAYGYNSATDVVNGWMNSPGHRANILCEDFEMIIVGVNGTNWVQLFVTLW